jgi:phage recombination protein Bet
MTQLAKTSSDWTRDQIDTIKQTVAKGASDSQLALFLEVCRSRGLDPFTKQVYFTPQGVIVSIDGFRAIADRTGCYAPGDATRFERDDKGNLIAAHVHVKKLVAGTWHRVEASAFYDEYRGTSPIWKKMPSVMLEKSAEARALRKSFPSELSGIYESSEMDQAQRDDVPVYREPVAQTATITVEAVPVAAPAPASTDDDHSASFIAARNAIQNANTIDALKTVAARIMASRNMMSGGEQEMLRAQYASRRTAIGG